jgi:hypothetical protein
MSHTLRRFDIDGLQAALDAERLARGLNWSALTDEINAPFRDLPSRPISVTTIKTLQEKRSVTSAVVLQVLRWLGRTPESFLKGRVEPPSDDEALPAAGLAQVLRFDTKAMHAALDEERIRRELSWRATAAALPGFSEGMLRNLARGPLIGFPRVMMIPQWLGRPAARFVRVCVR